MQEGILFESLLEQNSGTYIEQIVVDLEEEINITLLEKSWQKIIIRHPILRTSFAWQETDKPIQTVNAKVKLSFQFFDWRDLSVAKYNEQFKTYLTKDREEGFNLNQAPLTRVSLFRREQNLYTMLWTFHHILLDSRSFYLILKELFTIYESFGQHEIIELPETVPYQNYINWLNQQDLDQAKIFWQSQLKDFTTPTLLPINYNNKIKKERCIEEYNLSESLTKKLDKLAEENEITLNTICQGIWSLLLSRYSREQDVLFGAIRACRHTVEGSESMVGLLINTIPVRIKLNPEQSIISLLKQIRKQWIDFRQYEYTPLSHIKQWNDLSGNINLFDSLVNFENDELNTKLKSQGGNWLHRKFQLLEQAHYPLSLGFYSAQQLLIKIGYDRRFFDRDTITRMRGHIHTLFQAIINNPQEKISKLNILTEVEKTQTLLSYNNTQISYKKDKCIHQLLEEQVIKTPNNIAIIFQSKKLTYKELNEKANQLAHYLQEIGVKSQDKVAIYLGRSPWIIISLFAIMKVGASYVPFDILYPRQRIKNSLKQGNIRFILTQKDLLENFNSEQITTIKLNEISAKIASYPQDNLSNQVNSEDLAYVIFTSGSTGEPKGVAITHRSVINLLTGLKQSIYNDDNSSPRRVTMNGSLAFDTSVKQIIQLLHGHTLDIIPEDIRLQPREFISYLQQHQIDVLDCTPSQLKLLVNEGLLDNINAPKYILVGGEAIDKSLWLSLAQAKYSQIYNLYGPTECTVDATVSKVDSSNIKPNIGRAIANTQLYILDSHLQPLPIEITGELHIGGDGLARGYVNNPELTAEKFIDNPFGEGKLYKTGDLARYLPGGNIEYIGRIDNQVKVRGFRIELGEIEANINQHPHIKDTVVIALENTLGDKYLTAYLISQNQDKITKQELTQFLADKLPEYMIPVAFVFVDAFPLTVNGKIDTLALPKPDLETQRENEIIPPRTPIEQTLVNIWQKLLAIESISVTDSFFALGGHSLLAVKMVYEIKKELAIDLSLAYLWENSTIEKLALKITQQKILSLTPETLFEIMTHKELDILNNLSPQQRVILEKQLNSQNHEIQTSVNQVTLS
jgi:amino acid adenylation domain-containing protein